MRGCHYSARSSLSRITNRRCGSNDRTLFSLKEDPRPDYPSILHIQSLHMSYSYHPQSLQISAYSFGK
ncbi:ORF1086 [White spot syndrome virus]|uniref:ORF1086 n=1 Tax=White spot syndrome virus TaxID=342409 RepID=A0A2D3I6Q1_9VIRU|nr:ORF1086 [White spot syndrome virus]